LKGSGGSGRMEETPETIASRRPHMTTTRYLRRPAVLVMIYLAGFMTASGQGPTPPIQSPPGGKTPLEFWQDMVAQNTKELGAEHSRTVISRARVAAALLGRGQFAEAERELRALLPLNERVHGVNHTETLAVRWHLAEALLGLGKLAEAEKDYRALVVTCEEVLKKTGVEGALILRYRGGLAELLWKNGKQEEAEGLFRKNLRMSEEEFGRNHLFTISSRKYVIQALQTAGKLGEAETECRTLAGTLEQTRGTEHEDTFGCRWMLANLLQAQGKFAEEEKERQMLFDVAQKKFPPQDPRTQEMRLQLATALDWQGKFAEAETHYRAVLALVGTVLEEDTSNAATLRFHLARCLAAQKKFKEALELGERGERELRKHWGTDHPHTKNAEAFMKELRKDAAKER
jgi:tetratricopeptide (TPR) repeat protein